MTNMNIAVPEEIRAFIEARTSEEGYASVGEYLLVLIRDAQRKQAKQELEARLLEGLQGPSAVMTPEDWDTIERDAIAGLSDGATRP